MNKFKIGVIGLGYVGLPLILELGKIFEVFAYDKNKVRVNSLKKKIDHNNEHTKKEFLNKKILFSHDEKILKNCNFYIVCVPTPVTVNLKPDLNPLKNACNLIAKYLDYNDTVVFESTVYPGLIEEFCAKIIEYKSKYISVKSSKSESYA